jgi:hypothetical protein
MKLISAQRISIMRKAEYKSLSNEFRALYSRDDRGRDLVRKNYPFRKKGESSHRKKEQIERGSHSIMVGRA